MKKVIITSIFLMIYVISQTAYAKSYENICVKSKSSEEMTINNGYEDFEASPSIYHTLSKNKCYTTVVHDKYIGGQKIVKATPAPTMTRPTKRYGYTPNRKYGTDYKRR
jgi:hypothetical protein